MCFLGLIVKICIQPAQGFFFADERQRVIQLRAEWRPGDGNADQAEENARFLAGCFQ